MTINWLKKRCPVCSRTFEYPEGRYTPKTCNNFECVWEYNHNPEKYQSLMELIDDCRMKTKF